MSDNILNATIQNLSRITVNDASFKDDFEALIDDAETVIMTGVGACAVVQGATGTGKTTLVNKFVEKFNTVKSLEERGSQAIYVRSPSNMKPLDLLRQILKGLGEPGNIKGTEEEMKLRILKQLSNKNVRVIVFDEFQQVCEKLGEKSVRQQADYLKELMDEKNLFLLFSGTERVVEILQANEQFESRCTRFLSKELMSVDDESGYSRLASFLLTLQEVHQIKGIELSVPKVVLPMQALSNGDLRIIIRTLTNACRKAQAKGRDFICMQDFKDAWSKPRKGSKASAINPFKRGVDLLKHDLGVNYVI